MLLPALVWLGDVRQKGKSLVLCPNVYQNQIPMLPGNTSEPEFGLIDCLSQIRKRTEYLAHNEQVFHTFYMIAYLYLQFQGQSNILLWRMFHREYFYPMP